MKSAPEKVPQPDNEDGQALLAEYKSRKRPVRVLVMQEEAFTYIMEHLSDREKNASNRHEKNFIKRMKRLIRVETPKVKIEVWRGIAEVTKCPHYIEAEVIDHDNH